MNSKSIGILLVVCGFIWLLAYENAFPEEPEQPETKVVLANDGSVY